MRKQDYHRTITAKIPVGEAFDKINRVSDWWGKGLTGHSQKLGDTFTIRFGETFVNFEITDVVPGKKIVWRVADCNLHWLKDKKEWNNTEVIFEISSKNGKTQITMTHKGLVPGIECYDVCNDGWNFYIGESLLKFLTDNKGLPDGKIGSG